MGKQAEPSPIHFNISDEGVSVQQMKEGSPLPNWLIGRTMPRRGVGYYGYYYLLQKEYGYK